MKSLPKTCITLSAAMLVSACAAGSAGSSGPVRASAPAIPATGGTFRAPQVMQSAGLDSIIGERAGSLSSRFGDARIDLSEGDARKLQYVSDRCVLDIYLYPLQAGTDPVATHVEARTREGGGDTDRARCIADVERAATTR